MLRAIKPPKVNPKLLTLDKRWVKRKAWIHTSKHGPNHVDCDILTSVEVAGS